MNSSWRWSNVGIVRLHVHWSREHACNIPN